MADFTDMPPEERVRYLAGLVLNGKPRFPMLRKTCQRHDCCAGKLYYTNKLNADMSRAYVLCDRCQGRGWVPVDSEKALMEATDTFSEWFVGRWGRGAPVMAEVDGWAGEGESPAEALSLTLCIREVKWEEGEWKEGYGEVISSLEPWSGEHIRL